MILLSLGVVIVSIIIFYKYAKSDTYNNKIVVFYRKHYIKITIVLGIIAVALFIYALCCTPANLVQYSGEYMQHLVNNMNSL